jgi:hypothetical protein
VAMDARQPGFYLRMDYAAQGRRWQHIAGPFPSPDDASDATVDERDFDGGYEGCTLLFIDGQGYASAFAHPRSEHRREREEWEAARREGNGREGILP